MMIKNKRWIWNSTYTHKKIMKESRWLLAAVGILIMGGAYAFSLRSNATDPETVGTYIIAGILGLIYFVAGFIPSFWLRFGCILSIALVQAGAVLISGFQWMVMLLLLVTAVFSYKMIKYRNVVQEQGSEEQGGSQEQGEGSSIIGLLATMLVVFGLLIAGLGLWAGNIIPLAAVGVGVIIAGIVLNKYRANKATAKT